MGKRTLIGKFIHSSWTAMNMRSGKYRKYRTIEKCKSYENIKIEFTQPQYKEFCLHIKEYILSLKRPSVDRLDNKLNYTLDNIQIIELEENIQKDKLTFKDGKGVCRKCKIEKEITYFAKDKRTLNGYTTICKKCDSLRSVKLKKINYEHYKYNK